MNPDQSGALALATVVEEVPESSSNNRNAYAGAAFGVIGVIAAGALIANCNKKRTAANEEPLL